MGLPRKLEHTIATYHEMRRRGMRVVVGGDYGFTVTPMGQNARDIGHFVKFFGYSPAEALKCATAVGGDLMGHKGELGVDQAKARSPTCCSSTAIRSPTSRCWSGPTISP